MDRITQAYEIIIIYSQSSLFEGKLLKGDDLAVLSESFKLAFQVSADVFGVSSSAEVDDGNALIFTIWKACHIVMLLCAVLAFDKQVSNVFGDNSLVRIMRLSTANRS